MSSFNFRYILIKTFINEINNEEINMGGYHMEFIEFKKKLQQHVSNMLKNHETIFVTNTDKHILWDTYLDSFPKGTNEIFRKRRFYDCSCCRHFIYSFGNIVVIDNNQLISIWDFEAGDETYQPVIDELSKYVKSVPVENVFVTKETAFGVDHNIEQLENKTTRLWNHFRIKLPNQFVTRSSETVPTIMSEYKAVKGVFKRSLEEISKDSLETVLDLISQNSLHRCPVNGEWDKKVKQFLILHNEYHTLSPEEKDIYCWVKSVKHGQHICKIRNHSMGVLLTDLTDRMELDKAVRKWEVQIAGSGYKRTKQLVTEKTIKEAENTIDEMGYRDSLPREFATIEDVTINNRIFANKGVIKRFGNDIFSDLKKEAVTRPKKFNRIEEVSIEDFIKNILPRTTNVELYVENKHEPNLVSLIGPKIKDSKIMLKWNNPYTWAYTKNLTDSIKQQVKNAGGRVDGILRYSIRWNKEEYNPNDFDAHCTEPNKNHIYYPNKFPKIHPSSGRLDVDIINPRRGVAAVENITWLDKNKMQEGRYKFSVHCYSHNGGRTGFEAELDYEGETHFYVYDVELRQHDMIDVVEIDLDKKNGIKIVKSIPDTLSQKTIWNIKTNQFHPVTACMLSPNYWDDQHGTGHKHYFFMLKDCINNEQPNGFYNEFLQDDLIKKTKRVFEVLGSRMRVESSDNQLSGLGFNSTTRNNVICKVEGHITRTLKIMF